MTKKVYITSLGTFLPNEPIDNEEMENYLGTINGQKSQVRERVLKQNGIRTRYYAINAKQESTHSNAKMAALAVEQALTKSSLKHKDIQLLSTGTTQGDLPVPGFASMVHGELDFANCEVASFQSVCASGMMALKYAYSQIRCGDKENAVCVGSEFASRLFKGSRFEAQQIKSASFDMEFLRWMLSDGAGAFVLEDKKAVNGLSLSIDWIELKSHANEFPLCMYTGKTNNKNNSEPTWLDYPDYESASGAGAINLRQDTRLLDQVIKSGIAHYFELIDQGKINAGTTDWFCCHYSSH
ncbi:MAG: beta-ketoacyl synthase N-terminal-like domain-containing protein, partial [Cytophagaceae bacterium]